jgi:hypothetical protein
MYNFQSKNKKIGESLKSFSCRFVPYANKALSKVRKE